MKIYHASKMLIKILILACIVACQPITNMNINAINNCDIIVGSEYRNIIYGVDSETKIVNFFTNRFNLDNDEVTVVNKTTLAIGNRFDYRVMYWNDQNLDHLVYFKDSESLYSEHIWINKSLPYARDVIECLGLPEYYIAYYISNDRTLVELWYPKQGIVLTSHVSDDIPIDENILIDQVIYLEKSQNPEDSEILNNVVAIEHPTIYNRFFELWKRWPSDWSDIVIENALN